MLVAQCPGFSYVRYHVVGKNWKQTIPSRGAKRFATSEELVPATAPATKLHKDTSGDVLTAAIVAATVPTDAVGRTPAAQSMAQLTQVEWQAILARLTAVERLQAQLTVAQSQERKEKEKFMLFSDHNRSLLRRQPGGPSPN